MSHLLSIAVGGALGALARYGIGISLADKWVKGFPVPTLLINISGAFLLGLVNTLFQERFPVPPPVRLGIGVGFLGAYTTFSTFSFEIISLFESGRVGEGVLYAVLSLVLGLIGVVIGIGVGKLF